MSQDEREQPGPDDYVRVGKGVTEGPDDTEAHAVRGKGGLAEEPAPGPDEAIKFGGRNDDTEAHGARFGRDVGPDEAVRGKGGAKDDEEPGPDEGIRGKV